jgi:hypothetical protein
MNQRLALHTACLTLLASAIPHANAIDPLPPESLSPPIYLHSQVATPEPIQNLPPYVPAPEGRLTLFADFDHPLPNSIPLYLVNRTYQNIAFAAQDFDIYIKLQAEADNGEFVRAETHHYSTCGNSYDNSPVLKKESFFTIRGYQSAIGRKAIVRYCLYHPAVYGVGEKTSAAMVEHNPYVQQIMTSVISNAGPALSSPREIRAARTDDMAVYYDGDFNLVRDMAIGRIAPESDQFRWTRKSAIYSLARFNTDESANTLISLLKHKDLTEPVIQALAKLGPKNAKAESRFQELLYGQSIEHRLLAINALHYRGDSKETLSLGKSLLSEPNPDLRLAALKLLKGYTAANPELTQLIRKYEDDSDVNIRIFVAECDHRWSREEDWQRKSKETSQGAAVSNKE